MTRYRTWCLLLALAAWSSCKRSAAPSPSPAAVSSSPLEGNQPRLVPLPKLSSVVARQPTEGADLTTAAWLLVPHLTRRDPVGIALRWETAAGGTLTDAHPLASKPIDLATALDGLTVRLQGPQGSSVTLQGRFDKESKGAPGKLSREPSIVFWFDAGGLQARGRQGTWEQPAEPFPAPGRYTIHLSGKLSLGGTPVAFRVGDLALEVEEPSAALLTLAEIEQKAASDLATRLSLTASPTPSLRVVEDTERNRVVRFSISDAVLPRKDGGGRVKGEGDEASAWIESVLSPSGEVRSLESRWVSRCIAVGTRVATPYGARAIETLSVGDEVWGYDLAEQRRVQVRVQAVVRSYAERTLELRPGLRVTQEHPIWSGDQWTPAGRLQAGALVLDDERGVLALASGPAAAQASEVIDLTVDGPHNFFAGGLLVHNKMGANPVWQRLHQGSWGAYEMRPSEAP